jgi:hypothetical protein
MQAGRTSVGALVPAAMRITTSDMGLLPELLDFLRASEYVVEPQDDGTILVSVPRSLSADAARQDIELRLRLWRAMYPKSDVDLADD